MRLLNLGCGDVFHADWVNLDRVTRSPLVVRYDLRKALPFPDGHFDAVYHSHVLEHFGPGEGARFVSECARVLRPGGILRVVVPDLEENVRAYLAALSSAGDWDHEWMTIELLDQAVREAPGGMMARYLARPSEQIPNLGFVRDRIGAEVDPLLGPPNPESHRIWRRLARAGSLRRLAGLVGRARLRVARAAVQFVAGREAAADFSRGQFRGQGEVHKWMYDERSLRRLLSSAGLRGARRRDEHESDIPGFADYGFEVVDGHVRKPHSLVMEAFRPG